MPGCAHEKEKTTSKINEQIWLRVAMPPSLIVFTIAKIPFSYRSRPHLQPNRFHFPLSSVSVRARSHLDYSSCTSFHSFVPSLFFSPSNKSKQRSLFHSRSHVNASFRSHPRHSLYFAIFGGRHKLFVCVFYLHSLLSARAQTIHRTFSVVVGKEYMHLQELRPEYCNTKTLNKE